MGFSVSAAREAMLSELINDAQSAKSNETPAMRELIWRYEPLAQRIVSGLNPHPNIRDDVLNGARWGIVQAVRNHDGRPDGFTAYMTRYMRGEARRAVERSTFNDLPVSPDLFPEKATVTPIEPNLPDIPLHILSAPQRALVWLHYWEDQSFAAIARSEGTSLSAVRQRLVTIHRAFVVRMTADAA